LIRGIEAGADDYLFKPLDHEMMLARIKALVERKRNLDRQQRMREESILLTTLGGEVVDGLGGTVSDIDAAIDKMIRLQPRKTMDMIDKPRTVIIGLAQEGAAWIWRHYEYAFQELSRVTLDFNPIAGITLPEKGRSKMLHLSGPQLAPEAQMLIKNFHRRNISVENGLAYLHGDLCVLAVNFGREIDDDHVNFLRQTISLCRLLYLLAAQKRETVKAFDYGVYALARAAECHDDDTGSHALRVGDYCGVLAERLGLKEDFIQRISVQALLHDVGKIYTPSSILKKTEPLSPEEWVEMKKHTLWGGENHRVPPPLAHRPVHRAQPSRKMGRFRLSARPQGGGDPSGGAYRRLGRSIRRTAVRPGAQTGAGSPNRRQNSQSGRRPPQNAAKGGTPP